MTKEKKVFQICRKASEAQFSLERLKKISHGNFIQNDIEIIELPHESKGLLNKIKNIFFVIHLTKMEIVHVMGDIHYIIPFIKSKKTILTLLDFESLDRKKGISYLLFKTFWFDLPLTYVDKITTLSELVRKQVEQRYPKFNNDIIVINSPLDPIFEKEPNTNKEKNKILFIGVKDNKNLNRAVKALNDLSHENIQFTIIGPETPKILYELNDNISWSVLNNLSDHELLNEYDCNSILLFPSTSEGFGLPIVEAQSRKCIVITSDIEPMKSVAGVASAIFVDPYNIESIRNGIMKALNEQSSSIIENGYINSRKYIASKYINKHLEMYKNV